MAGLLDFAQAASNSAAGNVAGPIDMLAWGLRKMGLPIPNDPVLGTEWMKQKGLIKEVPQSPASLAGETLGLLSPIVAAAKAPQIAGGLLQMGDNLTTAKTLGSGPGGGQKGAIVYHGSPHKFDKFDSSKIGTGEGSQAYGHGLYLAEEPTVARSYSMLGAKPGLRQQSTTGRGDWGVVDAMIKLGANKYTGGDVDRFAEIVRSRPDAFSHSEKMLQRMGEFVDNSPPSFMYKVDLPDEHIARMLDWDKPLSQQAPEVQPILRDMLTKARNSFSGIDPNGNPIAGQVHHLYTQHRGGNSDAPIKTANLLRDAGIPGIRYLDGGSRAAGQGTANYVIFPGNEGLLTILERNGVPLR